MTDLQFAVSYLKAVEKKHKIYFASAHHDIMSCVHIEGTKLVSVDVIDENLPPEIRYDIEEMFWVH
ncbi:MAG: hypothetical protein ACXVA2_18430 [Mucilaginibacter sp.]